MRGDMTMLRGMCIGNCVGRQTWNGQISGTITPQSKQSSGISTYSVIGWLKLEGRTSSSLINKQGRRRSSTSLSLEMHEYKTKSWRK